MKYGFILGLFVILLSNCNNQSFKSTSESVNSIKEQVNNSVEFLSEFKIIGANGLHVYTITYDKKGNLINTPFEGHALDVKKYRYMDNKSIFFNIKAVHEGNSHIYAIGKFEINDNYVGLLIRQQSQYDESLIEIVLWDKNRKAIISSLSLADSFGDENWGFNKESWIKECQYNKTFSIVSWQRDKYSKENCYSNCDSIALDTFRISCIKGTDFHTEIIKQLDTLKFNLKNK
jgi:hypothetical protein